MMPTAINAINLENYTASKSFLDFFERDKSIPRRKAAQASMAGVLPFFIGCEVVTNCHLFESLDQTTKTYDIPEQDISHILEPLLASGIISSCANLDGEPALRTLLAIDNAQLEQLCLAVMEVDGVHGHLFLHKDGLVAYPHEDVGFGFFATEPSGAARGRQILEQMKRRPWR